MKINKQLFEDVLSGKLKGTFVFRNQLTCNSDELIRNTGKYKSAQPYNVKNWSYSPSGTYYFNGESNVDIIDFIPDTDMKENELTIEIPDGKVVDWEKSKKQNKIVLKDKQLTYEEICNRLQGMIDVPLFDVPSEDGNALVANEHQLECLLAKNKLANVAVYLNNGWKLNKGDRVFALTIKGDFKNSLSVIEYYFGAYYGAGENLIIFKTKEVAQQAIDILGEETIKLALEPLGI